MIIGLAGKLESGKDTIADYLVKEYGYTKMAFADNLKHMCMKVFDLTCEQCYTTEGKFQELPQPIIFSKHHGMEILDWVINVNKWPLKMADTHVLDFIIDDEVVLKSPRHILQFVGTEVCRHCFDDAFHARNLFAQIKREDLNKVVIADARFVNEREMIRVNKGINILIDCVQTRDQESTHQSEKELGNPNNYEYCIVNDKRKGLEELYRSINSVAQDMSKYENCRGEFC